MTHLKRAREVFDVELAAVKAVRSHLSKSFNQAVGLIVAALSKQQKIVVLGVGKSGNIGRKIAATFTSTGSPAVLLDTVDAMHGDLGILNDGDVLLALSYSGETDELINLLPAIRRFAVQIVAVTSAPRSSLAKHAEVVLNVKVPKEACPFNMAPTASTTASLVMGDALAMAVLDARGFKKSEFAKRHPSGAIGRALLLKVADIMRTGARTALVTTAGFTDVLHAARAARPTLYDSDWDPAPALVPRRDTQAVRQRTTYEGEVIEDLDEEGLRAIATKLREQGTEAIAINFLHSYINAKFISYIA